MRQNAGNRSEESPRTDVGGMTPQPARQVTSTVGAWPIAVHESALPDGELPEKVRAASKWGWTHIGMLRRSLWRFGEERTLDLLRDHQLGVSSLSWSGGFTGSAGFTFREAIEDGRSGLLEAQRIGARMLLVAPGARGGHTFRHAQRVITDGLRFLADTAARCGVTLVVLTTPGRRLQSRWTCIDTLELAHQLMDAVDSPWVGLSLSAERWHDHPAAASQLTTLAPHVQLVTSHLVDASVRTAAAQPASMKVLEQLATSGFGGLWELELPDEDGAAPLSCDAGFYGEAALRLRVRSGGRVGRW